MQLFNTIIAKAVKLRIPQIERYVEQPHQVQEEVFQHLINHGKHTYYGKKYHFHELKNSDEFRNRAPVTTYESLEPLINRTMKGEKDVLWTGETKWFAKSSGTTNAKSKFIPVTKESLEDNHFKCGKDLIALYYYTHPEAKLFTGKGLALGGSSEVNALGKNSYFGDLSALMIKNLPFWVELHRIPGKEIALLAEWEKKLEEMAKAALAEDITEISGVPSWTLVLLNKVLEITQKETIAEVWPNIELFVHGGVSFTPYREQYKRIMGKHITYLEIYNASEGFFGVQDQFSLGDPSLLLMLDCGIFYEFVPLSEIDKEHPKTISLAEVGVGKQYSLVISTTGGLWRYMPGDTITFTSICPYRIRVTGRTKHYINAFGEELIIENADKAIDKACEASHATVKDYTAAPIFMKGDRQGAHEWIIEFTHPPKDINQFRTILDETLKSLNSDYEAKRYNNYVLDLPQLVIAAPNTFYNWLKEKGKLGGQNKVPRLSNNRDYVESLKQFIGV